MSEFRNIVESVAIGLDGAMNFEGKNDENVAWLGSYRVFDA